MTQANRHSMAEEVFPSPLLDTANFKGIVTPWGTCENIKKQCGELFNLIGLTSPHLAAKSFLSFGP